MLAARVGVVVLLQLIPPTDPTALLDSALAHMGGTAVLESVKRARYEFVTQWQRTSFDARPYTDAPSYEVHSDLRDYTVPAWRNTRRFLSAGPSREITDVVRDTVAVRRTTAWSLINAAYLDERRELFAFAPERALLAARRAPDLRALSDTMIGGVVHARVSATIDGFPTKVLIRRSDGLPAVIQYRAAQPKDFGLAPWGRMDVELWLSKWQRIPGGVTYPMQWDVRRAGRPYKRMTLLSAVLNPPVMPDSFAVGDSLRAAFHATANKAMFDVPPDSARITIERFASFGGFGMPAGAVKLGDRWLLLEAGVASLTAERALAWLARADGSASVAGALLTLTVSGNGGVRTLAKQGIPLTIAPGAQPFVRAMLQDEGRAIPDGMLENGRWLRMGGDSMWVEPIDLPDARGSLVAYVPSLAWVYSGMITSPVQLDYVLALARRRGWHVQRFGRPGSIATPIPPDATH